MSVDSYTILAVLVLLVVILGLIAGIKVVPQSKVFVVERFGKFDTVLGPGLNFLVPGLQYIAHKVSVLERQLPTSSITVITRDNVQVSLTVSVFYRVTAAEMAVYRIEKLGDAILATTTAIIRAACGEIDFDAVQSEREFLNSKIKTGLADATRIWGIEITRTEVLDVDVDEATRAQMQHQLAADRERRATVLKAEGDRDSVRLAADAQLYRAQREAEAVRLKADAEAYATRQIAEAIATNGQAAIDFEIMKRKVDALAALGASTSAKVLVLPSDVTAALGSLETLTEMVRGGRGK